MHCVHAACMYPINFAYNTRGCGQEGGGRRGRGMRKGGREVKESGGKGREGGGGLSIAPAKAKIHNSPA